ncbi:MAG: hypothetical protein H6Q05_475 [Acidobacteria bacterium]|jgi:uncharacterized protein YdcH (DUF465 family)|nr:hypothetical protein [Acidobacteriota bacterium]
MSVPLGEAELRQQLLSRDEEFRKLAAEHQSYDEQLEQLSRRHHLSADERMQEITLKKKKLMLKDQMYSIVQRYQKETNAGS